MTYAERFARAVIAGLWATMSRTTEGKQRYLAMVRSFVPKGEAL